VEGDVVLANELVQLDVRWALPPVLVVETLLVAQRRGAGAIVGARPGDRCAPFQELLRGCGRLIRPAPSL